MKIGVVLPEVERWSSYYGGALARYSFEMIKYTDFSKYEINIYGKSCDSKYKYNYEINEPIFSKFTLILDKFLTKIKPGFAGWLYILAMYSRLKKNDLIHIHNRPFYAMILRRMGYKGKIIVHLNNDFNKSSVEYARKFINASDLIVSCSQKIADRIFEKYPEAIDKSRISYNGADDSVFKFIPFQNRKKQILFVGRIDEIKGVHNLIDAYGELVLDNKDWSLKLAGSATFGAKEKLTDYELLIKNKIDEVNKNGGEIEHLGYINHSDLPSLFGNSKLFCLPSVVHDAFPFVIVEAMFTGTPVIASRMGGIPESVGENGILCETNVDSLLKGLKMAVNNNELLENNAKNAYARAKNKFTWENIAKGQYLIYDELLSD